MQVNDWQFNPSCATNLHIQTFLLSHVGLRQIMLDYTCHFFIANLQEKTP
jgi:hypothetical protein